MHSLREHRESLGLSRKELAEAAGVTIGAVASVESGRGSRDKKAEEKIRSTLMGLVAPSTRRDDEREKRAFTEKARNATPVRSGWTILEVWEGLTPGSRFTVVGEEGVFSFLRHVTTDKGSTWVDCIGGERGYPEHFRSFKPERVRAFTTS